MSASHINIGLLPCARNFVIKKELFYSKVMWQQLLFAGYCAKKMLKMLHFKMTHDEFVDF